MSEDRKNELKKIAYSHQYVGVSGLFDGRYTNDEIEFVLDELEKLRQENLKKGIIM